MRACVQIIGRFRGLLHCGGRAIRYNDRQGDKERGRQGDTCYSSIALCPCLPYLLVSAIYSTGERDRHESRLHQRSPARRRASSSANCRRPSADRQPGAGEGGRDGGEPDRHLHPQRHGGDAAAEAVHRRLRSGRRRRGGRDPTRGDSRRATACGARARESWVGRARLPNTRRSTRVFSIRFPKA